MAKQNCLGAQIYIIHMRISALPILDVILHIDILEYLR